MTKKILLWIIVLMVLSSFASALNISNTGNSEWGQRLRNGHELTSSVVQSYSQSFKINTSNGLNYTLYNIDHAITIDATESGKYVRLSIFGDNGTGGPDYNNNLTRVDVLQSTLPAVCSSRTTFNIPDVSLQSGVTYVFVMTYDGGNTGVTQGCINTSGGYSNGLASWKSEGWSLFAPIDSGNDDFDFIIYYNETTGILVSLDTPVDSYLTNSANMTVTFNVSDPTYNLDTCKVYLNNSVDTTISNIANTTYDGNVTFTGLSEGSGQTWAVWCNNTNGDEDNSSRTFTVDLTNPSLIDNFDNNTMLYNENITGSFNFSDNIDLDYINISIGNTTIYYNSSITSTTLNYTLDYDVSNLSIGENTLDIEIYDGINTKTYDYEFYNINLTETYDAIAFNTIETTLQLDVDFGTLDSSVFSSYTPVGIIDFNGTNYTATLDSYTTSGATFTYDVTLPLNPDNRNITHKWYFNFSTLTDGYKNTSQVNQTFTDQSANITFTFYDELDNSLLNTTTISLDFIGDTYSYNYTTSNGTITLPLFFPQDYIVRFYATGYTERFHYFTISNDTSQSIDLYLLNDGNSTDVTATVYNEIGVTLEGVRIKVQKYDVTTNTFKQVEASDTNFEGQTILHLELNEEYYKFILEYPAGTVREITTPTYIFTNTLTFQIDTGEDIGDSFYTFDDVVSTLTFNPSTFNFKLIFNDVTGLSSQVCLSVTKNGVAYNSSCLSATSGTILLNIANETGVYKATAYLVYSGSNYVLDTNTQVIGTDSPDTSLGLYLIGFVTIVFIFVGFWNLSIALFITPIPLVIGSYLRITGISFGVVLSLQVLFIILAFIVARRAT